MLDCKTTTQSDCVSLGKQSLHDAVIDDIIQLYLPDEIIQRQTESITMRSEVAYTAVSLPHQVKSIDPLGCCTGSSRHQ